MLLPFHQSNQCKTKPLVSIKPKRWPHATLRLNNLAVQPKIHYGILKIHNLYNQLQSSEKQLKKLSACQWTKMTTICLGIPNQETNIAAWLASRINYKAINNKRRAALVGTMQTRELL